jgi:hypothetical protein
MEDIHTVGNCLLILVIAGGVFYASLIGYMR